MTNEITSVTVNPFATPAVQETTTLPSTAAAESSRAVAEVQAALLIARMNPRDQRAAMDRILNSCTRPSLASSAIYSYSRGGSEISGASIRLAECVAQQWGNMQFGIRELSNKGGKSEVQAFAWDVETNTRREVTFTVPHIRSTRKGSYKLEDPRDIYELVANQGARRLRACILAVIPGDVIEAAVEQCERTLQTTADVTPEGIKKMIDSFSEFGVTKQMIEDFCGCHADAINSAQIVRLKKVYRSIRDGFGNIEDWFKTKTPAKEPAKIEEKKSLKEKLKERAAAEAPTVAPVADAETGEVKTESAAPNAGDIPGEEFLV